MRLILLATIAYIVDMTAPVFTAFGHDFSRRDLILIAGGLFLVWKATREIHHTVDPVDHKDDMVGNAVSVHARRRDLPNPAPGPRLFG
jgi:predicted tellurium resistance membrane protein TerC